MRLFPALLLTSALATAGSLVSVVDAHPTGPLAAAAESAVAEQQPRRAAASDPDDPHTWQTSDQVPGEIVSLERATPTERAAYGRTLRFSYRVVPGVRASGWDVRGRRGPVRFYVLRVRWKAPGVKLDYAHAEEVSHTQKVTRMLARTPTAVAGVNGDFFDIGDTGAPLGIGAGRRGGLRGGIDAGWNAAIFQGANDRFYMRILPMTGAVEQRPGIKITNYNSPQVKIEGTGIYDRRWGRTSGIRWTDGQTKDIRVVHVVGGTVVSVANRARNFPVDEPIEGFYLVARGATAAAKLRRVRKGDPITVTKGLGGDRRVAITGNQIVLKGRKILATDDRELHPRTAVGIDRDHKQIIFLVVDGRQSFSRGYTMVEVARRLRRLGAEDGLNLDGGGSSTLAALRNGRIRVLNSPSDGVQRRVPNGLEVRYTK